MTESAVAAAIRERLPDADDDTVRAVLQRALDHHRNVFGRPLRVPELGEAELNTIGWAVSRHVHPEEDPPPPSAEVRAWLAGVRLPDGPGTVDTVEEIRARMAGLAFGPEGVTGQRPADPRQGNPE